MALLTTGLINNTEVSGIRASSTFTVRISNPEPVSANIRINGFYLNGSSKTDYVVDLLTLAPGEVSESNYYAQFDVFEFRFVTNSDEIEISAWGKNATGDLTVVHSIRPEELFPVGTEEVTGGPGRTIPSTFNRYYIPNYSSNNVSVIDGKSNTIIGSVNLGSGPCGVGVNPITNRIYVANYCSNTISVIDGSTNTVLTTVTVNINPVGVGVNPVTNRIYVTNLGSHNVSVIDGATHVVLGTITVGASPEGVTVNPQTNRIYITNHGSKSVSVINGTTNTVISTVDLES